eukprot:6198510-Pleurochrysis_carterae.AAC.1
MLVHLMRLGRGHVLRKLCWSLGIAGLDCAGRDGGGGRVGCWLVCELLQAIGSDAEFWPALMSDNSCAFIAFIAASARNSCNSFAMALKAADSSSAAAWFA